MSNATAVPLEVVAAITAALSVVLESAPGGFQIRSIQPLTPAAAGSAGAWTQAGRLEQHLARRQVQLRQR